jgi:hypothetical protein
MYKKIIANNCSDGSFKALVEALPLPAPRHEAQLRCARNAAQTQHGGQNINEFNDWSQIPNLEGAGSNPAGVTTVS